MNLCDTKIGEKVVIEKVNNDCKIYRRLLDIGVIPGTKVECVLINPSGNPRAYLIRGAVIAIRNEDAKYVEVA